MNIVWWLQSLLCAIVLYSNDVCVVLFTCLVSWSAKCYRAPYIVKNRWPNLIWMLQMIFLEISVVALTCSIVHKNSSKSLSCWRSCLHDHVWMLKLWCITCIIVPSVLYVCCLYIWIWSFRGKHNWSSKDKLCKS